MNRLRLVPAKFNERIYLDIEVDDRPLVTYFAGRLGALPAAISPLGWSTADRAVRDREIRRLLLEEPSDLPNGRNSILVCTECGDVGCGAFSAQIETLAATVVWSSFGREGDITGSVELSRYAHIGPFVFAKAEYENELRRNLANQESAGGDAPVAAV